MTYQKLYKTLLDGHSCHGGNYAYSLPKGKRAAAEAHANPKPRTVIITREEFTHELLPALGLLALGAVTVYGAFALAIALAHI